MQDYLHIVIAQGRKNASTRVQIPAIPLSSVRSDVRKSHASHTSMECQQSLIIKSDNQRLGPDQLCVLGGEKREIRGFFGEWSQVEVRWVIKRHTSGSSSFAARLSPLQLFSFAMQCMSHTHHLPSACPFTTSCLPS